MCLDLMSWVQQVHNAAVVARSLGCQCDTEMPTGSIVGQFPGSEISGVGNSREFPGIPAPGGNSREYGRSGGSRAGAASPACV